MYETVPDVQDFDAYEAEQERRRRYRKRIVALYEWDEMNREEEDEKNAGN